MRKLLLFVSFVVLSLSSFAQSFDFNGTNQTVKYANNAAFNIAANADYTIEWYQYTPTAQTQPYTRLFSVGGGSQHGLSIESGSWASGATFYYWINGTLKANFSPAPSKFLDKWIHFAIVRRNGTIRMYLNGRSQVSVADASAISSNSLELFIGSQGQNSQTWFKGQVTNFKWTNSALYTDNFTPSGSALTSSSSPILALTATSPNLLVNSGTLGGNFTNVGATTYSSATPFPFSAPVPTITTSLTTLPALSACRSTQSTTAGTFTVTGSNLDADITVTAPSGYLISTSQSSGFASSLTLTRSSGSVASTTIYAVIAAATTSPVSGNIALSSTEAATVNVAVSGSVVNNNVFEGALSFDGTNDKISVPDNNALDLTNNYTFEAWIYPKAFTFLGGIISKYNTNSSNGYMLRLTSSGNFRGLSFDGMETADNILNANTWYHIAAVNNNGTRTLYVNGTAVAMTGSAFVQANSDPLIIGKDFDAESGRRFFNGDIDEIRIWNTARTLQQITAAKDAPLVGNESNLVLYYNFNQGTRG